MCAQTEGISTGKRTRFDSEVLVKGEVKGSEFGPVDDRHFAIKDLVGLQT